MNNYKITYSNELYHHGVKGMKWGVWNEETKARYSSGSRIRSTPEELGYVKIGSTKDGTRSVTTNSREDAKWFRETVKNYFTNYNTAVEVMNEYLLPKINNDWNDVDISEDAVAEAKYNQQIQDAFNDALNTVGNYAVYHSPSGELMISYDADIKNGGLPAINIYSNNKNAVRAKKLEEAEDRALEKFNSNLERLNDQFDKSHGLSSDYDLGENPKLQKEYDEWIMKQYDLYIAEEKSKIK